MHTLHIVGLSILTLQYVLTYYDAFPSHTCTHSLSSLPLTSWPNRNFLQSLPEHVPSEHETVQNWSFVLSRWYCPSLSKWLSHLKGCRYDLIVAEKECRSECQRARFWKWATQKSHPSSLSTFEMITQSDYCVYANVIDRKNGFPISQKWTGSSLKCKWSHTEADAVNQNWYSHRALSSLLQLRDEYHCNRLHENTALKSYL